MAIAVVLASGAALAVTKDGTLGDDVIEGTGERDVIRGLAGADTITGYAGSDDLEGNDGPDTLYGGNPELFHVDGNDVVNGGYGNDDIFGGSGADELIGGPDGDEITDGPEDDAAVDRVNGGLGDDILTAANAPASRDNIFCGDGQDTALADDLDEVAADCETVRRVSEADTGLIEDAQWYTAEFGVTTEEALRNLRLQEDAGDLLSTMETNEAATFGDLEIRHEPEFNVEVNLTEGGMETVRPYVEDTLLEDVIDIEQVGATLAELEAAQIEAISFYEAEGVPFESGINVPLNRAEIYLTSDTQTQLRSASKAGLADGTSLPPNVAVVTVEELSVPMAVFYGGIATTPCTSGFTVRGTSSPTDEGFVTAGHCEPDTIQYRGQNFPMRTGGESVRGHDDVQFNRTPNRDDRALFLDRDGHGYPTRAVKSVRGRNHQGWGKLVCKSGKTSGYTCGRIVDRHFNPSKIDGYSNPMAPTFIRVDRRGNGNMVLNGDSGGPVFYGNTALGLVSAGIPNRDRYLDLVYMASNYVSGTGIGVEKIQTR